MLACSILSYGSLSDKIHFLYLLEKLNILSIEGKEQVADIFKSFLKDKDEMRKLSTEDLVRNFYTYFKRYDFSLLSPDALS